jgi:hypothetical protein
MYYKMISTSSIIIFGIIIIIAVTVIWKFWKKPIPPPSITNEIPRQEGESIAPNEPPPDTSTPPPMVFAVNDNGNLDLTDMDGKILNMSYGPNPKVYINLLDLAEKDSVKMELDQGVTFTSNVGNTKLYEVGGRPYIINYTRL